MSEASAEAGKELLGVLLFAYLRAWKNRQLAVDTGHVLELFATEFPSLELKAHTTALRSRAYGRGQPGPQVWYDENDGISVDRPEFEPYVVAAVRQSTFLARMSRRAKPEDPSPPWATEVLAATSAALRLAESKGLRYAHPVHLLAGIRAVTPNRATTLLDEIGIDADWIGPMVERATALGGTPQGTGALFLRRHGQLTTSPPAPATTFWKLMTVGLRRYAFEPVVMAVDTEAEGIAVKGGARHVNQAHYLAALAVLHYELDYMSLRFNNRWAAHNDAGSLLWQHGLDTQAAELHAYKTKSEEARTFRTRPWRNRTAVNFLFGQSVVDIEQKAHSYADRLGHAYVGTSHILLALVADETQLGCRLLHDVGVDRQAVLDDLASHVDEGGTAPGFVES